MYVKYIDSMLILLNVIYKYIIYGKFFYKDFSYLNCKYLFIIGIFINRNNLVGFIYNNGIF